MFMIGSENGFCSHTAEIWQFVGYFFLIFKVVIPVVLIIIGIISLGKAIVSTDEGEIKKAYVLLIKKFLIAVFIFFIPSIIYALFGSLSEFKEYRDDVSVCQECIESPNGELCTNKVIASTTQFSAY